MVSAARATAPAVICITSLAPAGTVAASAVNSWMKSEPVMSAICAAEQFLFLAMASARCRLVMMIRVLQIWHPGQAVPGGGGWRAVETPHLPSSVSPTWHSAGMPRKKRSCIPIPVQSRTPTRANRARVTDPKQSNVADEGGDDVEQEEDGGRLERTALSVGNIMDVCTHPFDTTHTGRVVVRVRVAVLIGRAEDLKEQAHG